MITVDIQTQGLKGIVAVLNDLKEDFSIRARGVRLNPIIREGTGFDIETHKANKASNSDIAVWLAEAGRDFFGATGDLPGADLASIVTAFEQEFQARAGAMLKAASFQRDVTKTTKGGMRTKREIVQGFGEVKYRTFVEDKTTTRLADSGRATRTAEGVAAKCLKAAMQEYMSVVTRNIQGQKTIDGSPSPLSEAYAKRKQKTFGFTTPIGVASGQLLANFNPSVNTNITITKDPTFAQELAKFGKRLSGRVKGAFGRTALGKAIGK